MATLIEFLEPLKKAPNRDKLLATLYFAQRHEGIPQLAVDAIRKRLAQARVAGAKTMNIADLMAKAGHWVDAPEVNGRGARLWRLTETGEGRVRELLSLPEVAPAIENDVAALNRVTRAIKDDVIRGYLEEAILCLQVGALRAAVVFLWTGAIRTLQEAALSTCSSQQITAALLKHDPKARPVGKVDDFAQVKDRITLLGLRELGVVDKGEWATLGDALDLRNRCGHPTKYRPGVAKASAFIEDVVGIAFA